MTLLHNISRFSFRYANTVFVRAIHRPSVEYRQSTVTEQKQSVLTNNSDKEQIVLIDQVFEQKLVQS